MIHTRFIIVYFYHPWCSGMLFWLHKYLEFLNAISSLTRPISCLLSQWLQILCSNANRHSSQDWRVTPEVIFNPNPISTPCTWACNTLKTCHRVFNNSASGIVPALVANVPVILCTGLLLNLSQSLHSCRRTHLHIAVVHNTVYYVSDICCKVLEMTLMPGLVLHRSWMMFSELPHPLFTFCYCFS